jgi:hypothetical protein
MSALLGFVGMAAGFDAAATNKKTTEKLGWKPTHVGLLQDIDQGTYFASAK